MTTRKLSVGSGVEGVHVYQTGSQSRNAVRQEVKEAADLCPDGYAILCHQDMRRSIYTKEKTRISCPWK